MKAIIYARVSTEEQKQGFSLDAQIESCSKYCESKEWEVVKIYKEIGSAKERDLSKRPKFLKALELINSGVADILVAWKLDRISRKWSYHGAYIKDKIGYNFSTVKDSIDGSTASGRFVIDLIFRIAEWESEQIGERVKMGIERAKKEGKQIGWKKGKPKIPQWKKDKIIEMFNDGATYAEIRKKVKVASGTITKTLRDAKLIA